MRPKRVLIVDDSPTIRQLIRAKVAHDPRLIVVGEAADPFDAREKIKLLSPDVLTLDVEMPRMNGLEFLEKLMRLRPMPVIMVSTETFKGSVAALEALSLGAVDCVGKPQASALSEGFDTLADLLVMAADAQLRGRASVPVLPHPTNFDWNGKLVVIGSSTGGVTALENILAGYPANGPPTMIAQHMPESFLASFARRLSAKVAPQVELARQGAPLLPGRVYLAPGGAYHLGLSSGDRLSCEMIASEKCNGHRPSVEVLFRSAQQVATHTVAVMLTGMGRDGAEAMLGLRQAGARCLAQDQGSCVVFGMPRAALDLGAAEAAVPLDRMAQEILRLCSRTGENRANMKGMGRS